VEAAALQPPSLKAICPWEGFTDAYRDLMRPGGIREGGFLRIWSRVLRRVRQRYRLVDEQRRRPLLDGWWRELVPALEQITVPALICGSFSDNNLHSRGSFRGWEGVSSSDRFLYTHRGGKWTTCYAPRPAPRSSGSSTATCAAAMSRRRHRSGWRSASAATWSPACARRGAGRWTAPSGRRCT
jgi:predicted acyl esterase